MQFTARHVIGLILISAIFTIYGIVERQLLIGITGYIILFLAIYIKIRYRIDC